MRLKHEVGPKARNERRTALHGLQVKGLATIKGAGVVLKFRRKPGESALLIAGVDEKKQSTLPLGRQLSDQQRDQKYAE